MKQEYAKLILSLQLLERVKICVKILKNVQFVAHTSVEHKWSDQCAIANRTTTCAEGHMQDTCVLIQDA